MNRLPLRSIDTSRSRLALVAVLLLGCCGALACAEPVRTQVHPGLRQLESPIDSVAVVPVQATGSLATQSDTRVGPPPEEATALVSRHIGEALGRRGVNVVAAEDSARALGLEAGSTERLVPRAVARVMHEQFGVDAVLMGTAWRYVERSGQAAGTRRPASVGFEVVLYEAPGGQKLWSSIFNETQQGLGENVLTAGRLPGGGTRWLTAEELLSWGATETAAAVPLGPQTTAPTSP